MTTAMANLQLTKQKNTSKLNLADDGNKVSVRANTSRLA